MSVDLLAHQQRFVEISGTRPRFAWFASPGVGKTIGTLAACAARPIKTVVLAPKSVLRAAWQRDAVHFPALRCVVIDADTPKRASAFATGEYDIVVTNYDMFKRHAKELLQAGVRRLVIDESSKCRNPDAQITKAAQAFGDRLDEVYILSGTPAPNNGTEYWAQLRVLGPEAVNRQTYWGFCYRYFTPKKRRIYLHGKPKDIIDGWSQTPEQAAALAAHLNKWCWFLHKSDCLDLPVKHDIIVPITLSPGEASAYKAAKAALKLKAKDGSIVGISPNAATMKLRQITGGAVKVEGETVAVGGAKLDALGDLLDSLAGEAVIVWAEFTDEVDRIADMIRERGETVDTIDGRTSDRAGDTAARFQRGELKRLVCHPAAAGHGITLTAAAYAVYYSLSFSFEQYEQSRDRIHRVGQSRPCTYYHLIVPDTVDDGCLRVVQRKAAASEELRKLCGDAHGNANIGGVHSVTVQAD